MENKKINVSFGIVVIAFLVIFYILIKDENAKRVNDYKVYEITVAHIVKEKNDKIRFLANLLAVKQKENDGLKNTLRDTRNDLDALSKKLAQPVPVAAPAPVSAPAPVAAPAPAAAAK